MNDDIVYWQINQGEDFEREISMTDDDGNEVDFTGYTAKMQFRSSAGGHLYLEATTAKGNFSIDPVTKKLKLKIKTAVVDQCSFTTAVGDLFVYAPVTLEPEKLFRIQAKLIKKVTA